MFTYTLNNQYIITKSYIQKVSSLLTQKKHCFISLQQRLKTVFLFFFNLLIAKSTNWQIDKLANRQIAKSANRLFLQLIELFDVFCYCFGHIICQFN